MARQPPRLLEAVSRRQTRCRRAEPGPSTPARSAAASRPSCQQQLGSGSKIFRGSSLVVRSWRRRSCQQQLGFGASLYPAKLHPQTAPPGGVLQTTSLWCEDLPGLDTSSRMTKELEYLKQRIPLLDYLQQRNWTA